MIKFNVIVFKEGEPVASANFVMADGATFGKAAAKAISKMQGDTEGASRVVVNIGRFQAGMVRNCTGFMNSGTAKITTTIQAAIAFAIAKAFDPQPVSFMK